MYIALLLVFVSWVMPQSFQNIPFHLTAVQVEQSPPLSEPPHQEPETRTEGSLFDNPPVLLAMVQYFFRVTSPESFDEEMIKRIVSKTSLPLTEQFDKTKVAQVFTRYRVEKS